MTLKKHLSIGPGGMKCRCCFPPRGKRKPAFRSAKRKYNIAMMKDALND